MGVKLYSLLNASIKGTPGCRLLALLSMVLNGFTLVMEDKAFVRPAKFLTKIAEILPVS